MSSTDLSESSASDSRPGGGHIDDDFGSQRRVPVINLPHRWDENDVLIPESVPEPCQFCNWNGIHELFLSHLPPRPYTTREGWEAAPSSCAYHQLRLAISMNIAHNEGDTMTDMCHRMSPRGFIYTRDEQRDDEQQMFIQSDLPKLHMGKYQLRRRQLATGASVSELSWRWAQSRLDDCLRLHELCNPQKNSSFLPRRLLNIRKNETCSDIRLQSTKEIPLGPAHAALSYCLGGLTPECTTTPATLHKNMKKIAWDSLPATFQDAINVTRGLGLEFLWIDSVCIIQGDQKDWTHQSGEMYLHVYSNAHVTIAALFGQDSTSGLRNTSTEASSRIVAELRLGSEVCPLFIRRRHLFESSSWTWAGYVSKLQKYPLLNRAWAYQECIVSPRNLIFTESETIFWCFENIDCECGGIKDMKSNRLGVGSLDKSRTATITRKRPPTACLENGSDNVRRERILGKIKKQWREVVVSKITRKKPPVTTWEDHSDDASYQRTHLMLQSTWRDVVLSAFTVLFVTVPTDKLPALGAVAELFQRVRPGETCLAGLWSGSLVADLGWACDRTALRTEPKIEKELARPFQPVPTWSWASLQSKIRYLAQLSWGVGVEMVRIVDVQCRYLEDNPFDVLVWSRLVLRGRILKCLLYWDDQSDPKSCHLCHLYEGCWSPLSPLFVEIHMDHDHEGFESQPNRQEVYVSEILRYNGTSALKRVFLILRLVDYGNHVYTRKGIMLCSEWLVEGGHRRQSEVTLRDRSPTAFEDHFAGAFENQSMKATFELR